MNRRAGWAALAHVAAAAFVAAGVGCSGSEPTARPDVIDAYGLRVESADLGDRLHLFTWSDYLDPALVEEFEDVYGVSVSIDYYDTNEALVAKLQAGGDGQYDVVIASDYAVEVLANAGRLLAFDTAHVPNRRNLDVRFRDPPYDPGSVHSMTYQWGTSGLGIRTDELTDPAQLQASWRLVFDPSASVGPFTMLGDQRETIGAALIYLGFSANSTDPGELAAAERLLIEQRSRVLTYAPFATARDLLASGDAVVAHNYSGDVLLAQAEQPAIRFVIPIEGSIIWTDNMAIPAGAPHKLLAEAFVNFILDANVGARLSNFTRYASPNAAAMSGIDPALLDDRGVYPDSATLERLEFLRDVGPARAMYDRIWTRIRAGGE